MKSEYRYDINNAVQSTLRAFYVIARYNVGMRNFMSKNHKTDYKVKRSLIRIKHIARDAGVCLHQNPNDGLYDAVSDALFYSNRFDLGAKYIMFCDNVYKLYCAGGDDKESDKILCDIIMQGQYVKKEAIRCRNVERVVSVFQRGR